MALLDDVVSAALTGLAQATREVGQAAANLSRVGASERQEQPDVPAPRPRPRRPQPPPEDRTQTGTAPRPLPLQTVVQAGEEEARRAREGTDPTVEFSRLIQGETAYRASLRTLEAGTEMSDRVLSIQA